MTVATLASVAILLSASPVAAHCPLCTGAVAAGAVAAKYAGVDLSVIAVFAGAFAVSTGLWISRKITRRFIPLQTSAIVLASFLLTIIPTLPLLTETGYLPLFLAGEPGSWLNRAYFIDKGIFGSAIGSLLTLVAYRIHVTIKAVRGRVLVPFQGTILTILALIAGSLPLHLLFS